jgi:hypothetical protein
MLTDEEREQIAEIRDYWTRRHDDCEWNGREHARFLISIIERLTTWISVEDVQIQEGDERLIHTKNGYIYVAEAFYMVDGEWHWFDGEHIHDNVDYIMPLPDPPDQKKKETEK